jgi:diacylglycerol kinase family enzyme
VVNADGVVDWARTLARTAAGNATKSPFVSATKARRIKVKLDRKVLYELDGGDREKVRAFDVKVEPSAVTVCLPTGGV